MPTDPPPLPPPIAYATPVTKSEGRPGLLTAVAVVGLIVAAVGLVVGLVAAAATPSQARLVNVVPGPPSGAPPTPSSLPPYAGDPIGPAGLPRATRAAVLARVSADPACPPDRRVMLDRLLGEFGRVICPTAPADPGVRSLDHLPFGPDGAGVRGTLVVHLATGTIACDDAEARFQTDAGGAYVVRQDAATDAAGRVTRSAVAVGDMVDVLHATLGPTFNATQAAVVAADLSAAGPSVAPARTTLATGGTAFSPMRQPHLVGQTVEYGYMPTMLLLPNGAKVVNLNDVDPATGVRRRDPRLPTLPPITPAVFAGLVADAVVSAALAVWLAAAAVGVLADRPTAPAWVARYAWARIGLAAVWLAFNLAVILPRQLLVNPNLPPEFPRGFAIGAAVVILVQCLYPLFALRALRAESVRTYLAQRWGQADVVAADARARWAPPLRRAIASPAGRVATLVAIVAAAALAVVHLRSPGVRTPAGDFYWFDTPGFHAAAAVACFAVVAIAVAAFLVRPSPEAT